MHLLARSEAETLAVGRALGAAARPGDVIAIDGPLGAGKTRLVRGIALSLGFAGGIVSSPTFVVVNEYAREGDGGGSGAGTAGGVGVRLFHVDAYRLSGVDDLESLGWDRVTDGSALVAVEWAERLGDAAVWASAGSGAEPSVWRVRMEPTGPEGEGASAGKEPAGPPWRRIEIVPPSPLWTTRGGAADLERAARVLSESGAAGLEGPLPRGWIRCATTGKPVPPDSPTFPFADERARMADLGRWMSGAYTLSREITEEDEDEAGRG